MSRLVARWLGSPSRRSFTDHRVLPAREARVVPLPEWIDPRLRLALERRGVTSLYAHQQRAAEALRRSRDVVVATPTASGKTLCYNLPVLQQLLDEPRSRALYLFPTKALARDQVAAIRALSAATGERLGVVAYDGDTPPAERRLARKARVVATNPDMLHAGLLPHHPSWAEWLGGLTHVVVDELHTYRGVFGSHVANVLRRLRRIAAFHGASPRFVGTSATIANPDELASQLFGGPVQLVRESGAPSGPRHFVVYNPPPIDQALGIRESYLKAACRITAELVAEGINTIVFCRSRQSVEVLVHYIRETIQRQGGNERPAIHGAADLAAASQQRVRGYRGGYLPDRRRGIEAALRSGETQVVVATSALELGIDIGSLDAVVLAGWPGSRAAAWQRAGRAGRRLAPSLTVMVCTSDPLDQFVAAEPDYFYGQAPEHARIDANNVSILVPHIKCAAFELPFTPGERFGTLAAQETEEVLSVMAESALLHRTGTRYHYVASQFPANDVPLRGPLDENFLVVDSERGEVIAEVDYRDAPQRLHDHAVYQLEGQRFLVKELAHDAHKAYVTRVDIDYYTEAMTRLRLRVLECIDERGACAHGEIQLLERVVGFKKIKLFSHENIGYGEVNLPERQMHTTSMWLRADTTTLVSLDCSPVELAGAALGLSSVLHSAAALILMGDGRDLGRSVGDGRSEWYDAIEPAFGGEPSGTPTIFLYDRFPGGIGLAERLFDERVQLLERAEAMLTRCECREGCPSCVGPARGARAKALALELARLFQERLQERVRGVAPRVA